MREILCAEQPCVLCGQLLEIVTIHRDDNTDLEEVRRERVEHSHQDCIAFAKLYLETWPCHAGTVSPAPQGAEGNRCSCGRVPCLRFQRLRNTCPGESLGAGLTRSGDMPLTF